MSLLLGYHTQIIESSNIMDGTGSLPGRHKAYLTLIFFGQCDQPKCHSVYHKLLLGTKASGT